MQLSVNIFLSLDGVMQGPGGPDEDASGGFERGGWLVPHFDVDVGRIVDSWFGPADAILLGRTTYQMMRTYWAAVTDQDDVVAVALNTYRKYVVSTTLSDDEAGWQNSTVIRDDILGTIRGLKQQPGRELQVHGSWQLARSLHDAGVVDIYRLLYFPVVVGGGKRLFDDNAVPSSYRLIESKTTGSGAFALTLQPTEFGAGEFVVRDGKEATEAAASSA